MIHNNGPSSIQVNLDGTHTVVHNSARMQSTDTVLSAYPGHWVVREGCQ